MSSQRSRSVSVRAGFEVILREGQSSGEAPPTSARAQSPKTRQQKIAEPRHARAAAQPLR